MKISTLTLTMISAICLISCNPKQQNSVNNETAPKLPYSIDLENYLNKTKRLPLSTIGKTIEYVPLETTDKSLLRRITQIIMCDSFIFISDFSRVLQFKRNGEFVRQVGSNGRGPGEYINASGFCIDDLRKRIYISGWSIKTVLEYDYDGKFIRPIPQNIPSSRFLVFDNNKFIFQQADMPISVQNSSEIILSITDTLGNQLKSFKNYHPRYSKSGLMIGDVPMYYYNNSLKYMQFGSDTIFTVTYDKLKPYAIVNLGKMKMDSDPSIPFQDPEKTDKMKQLDNYYWTRTVSENKDYIFVKLNYGLSDSSAYCVINKVTQNVYSIGTTGLDNDLDGAASFWPKYVFQDSILIDYIEAFKLLEYTKTMDNNKVYSEKLQMIKSDLTETANPVIILINNK